MLWCGISRKGWCISFQFPLQHFQDFRVCHLKSNSLSLKDRRVLVVVLSVIQDPLHTGHILLCVAMQGLVRSVESKKVVVVDPAIGKNVLMLDDRHAQKTTLFEVVIEQLYGPRAPVISLRSLGGKVCTIYLRKIVQYSFRGGGSQALYGYKEWQHLVWGTKWQYRPQKYQ